MEINVMSYNIQHGVDYNHYLTANEESINLSLMAEVMRRHGAQIIGLNEVRDYAQEPLSARQADQLGELLGYHAYFAPAINFGENRHYGNGLLSAFPILSACVIPIPDPPVKDEDAYYETRCILKAELDVPGGLTVLVCHFGLAKSEERLAADTILDQIARISGPMILMGDFNIESDDDNIARLSQVLEDTVKYMAPGKLSWPSDKPDRKIDYIFTRGVEVLASDIPAETASDHRPHTAKIIVK